MKKYTAIILFCISSFSASAQINYSEKIPAEVKIIFQKIETTLKARPFTQQKTIWVDSVPAHSNTSFAEYKIDSLFYSNILQQFTDTSLINKLPELKNIAPNQKEEGIKTIKAFTINSIVSIHNNITCVDNNLLFVMPAYEYNQKDTNDSRFRNTNDSMYVAGFFKDSNYYPALAFQFAKEKKKFIYISLVLNFDDYTKQKSEFFEKKISPFIEPCIRIWKDRNEDNGEPELQPVTHVIEKHL